MSTLTIGQLAKCAGVGVETIRFYQRERLLEEPERLPSGFRQYGEEAVERVKFLRHAQRLGFTLKDAKDLLELKHDPKAVRSDVRDRASRKLSDIREKIKVLEAMRDDLTRLIAECDGHGPAAHCPIIQAIDTDCDAAPLPTGCSGHVNWENRRIVP